MDRVRSGSLAALLLVGVACKPPGIRLDGETGAGAETSSSSESSTSDSTDSTETSDSTDSSTTSDESGPSFLPVPDVSGPNECDMLAQDCPDGDKCIYDWNDQSYQCVPVTGDQAPGETCTYDVMLGTDDCDATSLCWDVVDVNGTPMGVCAPFCMGTLDNPECPPQYDCLIADDITVLICIHDCDPLVQDCSSGTGCYWANNGFSCIFTTQDIPPGQPCNYINDCAPGEICVDASTLPTCADAKCCTVFCDLLAPDCAALPGTECVAFFGQGMAPPGYENVGTCIHP